MPTINEPIGVGQSGSGGYETIQDWLAAHQEEDLAASNTIYVGDLVDDVYFVNSGNLAATTGMSGTRSATGYRYLKNSSSVTRYRPDLHQGPRIIIRWSAGSGDRNGLWVAEDFFRLSGVGLFFGDQRETGTGTKSGILVQGNSFRCFSTTCVIDDSSERLSLGTSFYCYNVNGASDAQFYNAIAVGGEGGKGASVGFLYQNGAQMGGVYNCAAYRITNTGARGFWALPPSASTGPEILNCVSHVESSAGELNAISGLWRTYGHNITSDLSAEASISGGVNSEGQVSQVDPNSHAYQNPTSIWLKPDVHDFNQKASSIARAAPQEGGGGKNLLNLADQGFDTTQDYVGPNGIQRAQGIFGIGPFDRVGTTNSSAPTEVVRTIGQDASNDFQSIQEWLDATDHLHLYNRNEVQIGELQTDGPMALPFAGMFVRTCITDSRHYREIRAASGSEYDPVTGTGNRLTCTGTDVVRVFEPYFRMSGVRVDCLNSAAYSRTFYVRYPHARLDAIFATQVSGTTGGDLFQVQGNRAQITNCIAKGSGDGVNGANGGFRVNQCQLPRIYNSIADGIAGGAFPMLSGAADRPEVSNCIATDSSFGFSSNLTAAMQRNNISQDASANGPGSQQSVSRALIWVDPDSDDYRLVVGSPAERAGANLSFFFSRDWSGNPRTAPFDVGIYEGVQFPPLLHPGRLRNDHARLCTLWTIERTDGVAYYFTDTNEPIVHAGRTFTPVDSINASNRREEGGLNENSAGFTGISSSAITTADLRAGRFRDAKVTEKLVDFKYPFGAPHVERVYWIESARFDSELWHTDVAGVSNRLERRRGRVNSPTCPYIVGSEECGVDLSSDTLTSVAVTQVPQVRREFDASGIPGSYADDFFGLGELVWLTGSNAGIVSQVKTYTQGPRRILLQGEVPFGIQIGDTFQVKPGCRGRYVQDCIGKYSNGRNFGGEPFQPGTDSKLVTPRR